jgi:hypothetical protein
LPGGAYVFHLSNVARPLEVRKSLPDLVGMREPQNPVCLSPAPTKDKQKLGLKSAVILDSPKKHRSGYKYHPKGDVIKADQIEDELFRSYQHWLGKKGHKLRTIKYNGRLQCDGYEEDRRNLIEAKASTSREDIRMAVGQLLDYNFLGKGKFGDPNKAILLPKKPDSDLEKWLQHLHISIIWREGGSFSDNADGKLS